MAVYTKVSGTDASDFLNAYDLGDLRTLTGIKRGVENTNYILTTTKGRYILTLYEKRTREEDLPFFLSLLEHLATTGVPCPLPMKMKNGGALARLLGRPAAIVSFLEGEPVARSTPDDCAELGLALATMHNAASSYRLLQRPNALSLAAWNTLLAANEARADEVMSGLGALLRKELDYLRSRWPKDLPRGIIHADLFPDNVFFDAAKLCGLIDFYFACNDFLAYDLAICLNAWCFENSVAFNITKARALLKGYQQARKLTPKEISMLPLLARGAAVRFLLTRLNDWLNQVPGALVKAKDPLEYLTRCNSTRWSRMSAPTASSRTAHEQSGSRDFYRRRLLGQSGPGRLGCDHALQRHRERIIGRRKLDHQQPHGIDGGDHGARGAHAALASEAAHRQPVCAEGRRRMARAMDPARLENRRQKAGQERRSVATPASRDQTA